MGLLHAFLATRGKCGISRDRNVTGFSAMLEMTTDDYMRRRIFHAWPSETQFPFRALDREVARRVFGKPDDVKPYSTDLRAAWLIIQRYCDSGCSGWISDDGHCGLVAGVTNSWGEMRHEVYGFDWADPCIALCLAALKAADARDKRTPTRYNGAHGVAMKGAGLPA